MFGPFKKNNEEKDTHNTDEQSETTCAKCSNNEPAQTSEINTAELEKKIEACELELSQSKDQFFRLSADFHNYKKRVEKDRLSWMHSMQASYFEDILAIVNDFDRAIDSATQLNVRSHNEQLAQSLTGFSMIRKTFTEFLKRNNIEPIAQMTTFDPELHEALMHVDTDGGVASGDIVQVFEMGYMLNGAVIKPAKVSVAK